MQNNDEVHCDFLSSRLLQPNIHLFGLPITKSVRDVTKEQEISRIANNDSGLYFFEKARAPNHILLSKGHPR